MRFRVGLDKILEPLQIGLGAVVRRQSAPILSSLHCSISESLLTPVGSGLEVELSSTLPDESDKEDQEFTVPGRKS